MTSSFPLVIDDFTNPTSADNLNTPTVLHSTQHANVNDAVEALEAKVGANSSVVTTSHDYKIAQLEASSHAAVTLGTANGLSLVAQALSLGVASASAAGALSAADWSTFAAKLSSFTETDPVFLSSVAASISAGDISAWDAKQDALSFPLVASLGGLGVNNGSATLTLPNFPITIAGGVTGGTYTLPSTAGGGTFALLGTANVFTAAQTINNKIIQSLTLSAVATQEYGIAQTLTIAGGASNISATHHGFNTTISITGSAGAGLINVNSYTLYNYNTGTVSNVFGLNGTIQNYAGSGTILQAVSIRGSIAVLGAGNIDTGAVLYASSPSKGSTGNIANNYGAYIQNMGLSGTTIACGVFIDDQTGATNNYSIYTSLAAKGARFGHQLVVEGSTDVNQLKLTSFTTQTLPPAYFIDNTAATAVIRNVLQLETQSTGTADVGLGAGLLFSIETSTPGTMQSAARVYAVTIDKVSASRKYALVGTAFDTAEREGWRVEASGTAAKVSLFGVAPVIQPAGANQAALTNSTSGTYDGTLVDVGLVFSQANINDNFTDVYTLLTEIRTALVNTGIMKGAA